MEHRNCKYEQVLSITKIFNRACWKHPASQATSVKKPVIFQVKDSSSVPISQKTKHNLPISLGNLCKMTLSFVELLMYAKVPFDFPLPLI